MPYSKKDIENIFDSICEQIENGKSLRAILLNEDMPSSRTFYKWLEEKEDRVKQYARATQLRAEQLFDEMIEISDTPVEGVVLETDESGRTKEKKGDMLGHRRLQIDTRKWTISKMNPKKYGDKLDVTTDGESIQQPVISKIVIKE